LALSAHRWVVDLMDREDYMTAEAPRLMTTTEVAQLFAVNGVTVRRWEQDGILAASRVASGNRRFDADEVEALHQISWYSRRTHPAPLAAVVRPSTG
jgi:excisionase family DNA binding protein